VVQLEDWDNTREYDRTGLDQQRTDLLDVELPLVTVPLNPGKNLTVICEVVAMTHLLRYSGVDSATAFNERLIRRMREKGGARGEWRTTWKKTMSELRGVIVSHAAVAQALVSAVTAITGIEGVLTAVSNEGCGTEALGQRLREAVGAGPAVLFVDLPGGRASRAPRATPSRGNGGHCRRDRRQSRHAARFRLPP